MEQHYAFFCRCHAATPVELAVLRWLQAYVPAATGSVLNALCIAGYWHERTSQTDLMVFMIQYRPVAEAATFNCPANRQRYGDI